MAPLIAGIFVGGQARRMNGAAKGLLWGPDKVMLVERWLKLFEQLGVPAVLVGASDAYRNLDLPMLKDDPVGVGPLGGLIALLKHASTRRALVVACDMPWVSLRLLERLVTSYPEASLLAAAYDGQWQPFFARHEATVSLPIAERCLTANRRGLHHVLTEANAQRLELNAAEASELRDWDSEEDIARDGGPWPV
ncbi:MAG TPA: molybdenum cofactor guanylyltransferase [Polyangiaceae bacterium]|nr:molybdenum cofactor guanylyltransferase [Polyangiaceae bacterium]